MKHVCIRLSVSLFAYGGFLHTVLALQGIFNGVKADLKEKV
jgi:hypothetical protein